jgi:putative tryptophan/tyrosine transport system substrate-binding protein
LTCDRAELAFGTFFSSGMPLSRYDATHRTEAGMRRREFFGVLIGATTWPVLLNAQQANQKRRIGVLFVGIHNAIYDQFISALTKSLSELGWTAGENIQIDYRWSGNDLAQARVIANELLSLKPDVILTQGSTVEAFQRATKTVPIVFATVIDPVASGFVASLSHPGGNITGFSNFEPTLVGKYIEILKEIIPGMTAVVDIVNPDSDPSRLTAIYPVLKAAAQYHKIEFVSASVSGDADIERVISDLGKRPTTGLIVAGHPFMGVRLKLITSLTIRHRVPAIYSFRFYAEGGGLISWGNDLNDEYRRAGEYIDRILKGADPANLPVQLPTKFEMVVNLKTAKAMDLTIPPTLLTRADEVIE